MLLSATLVTALPTWSGGSSGPVPMTSVGNTAFFMTGHASPTGVLSPVPLDLWRTDGTASGTALVSSFSQTSAPGVPITLLGDGGFLYYAASAARTGNLTLYRADPVAKITTAVTPSDFIGRVLKNLTAVGGSVFFSAFESNGYDELWVLPGTSTSATQITPPAHFVSASLGNFVDVNGTLYFTANDGTRGLGLWRSDGTVSGTTMVAGVGTSPANLTAVNGALFFTAADAAHGTELWRSDGTAAGTALLADIAPGATGSSPSNLTNVDGRSTLPPTTRPTAPSCGGATAPPPVPRWCWTRSRVPAVRSPPT